MPTSVTFGRLFTNPGKIVCIGLNYRAHIAETGLKLPSVPILFNKYNNSLGTLRFRLWCGRRRAID